MVRNIHLGYSSGLHHLQVLEKQAFTNRWFESSQPDQFSKAPKINVLRVSALLKSGVGNASSKPLPYPKSFDGVGF